VTAVGTEMVTMARAVPAGKGRAGVRWDGGFDDPGAIRQGMVRGRGRRLGGQPQDHQADEQTQDHIPSREDHGFEP